MSKIPPRTLNWATSSTIGTRSKPIASRCEARSSGRRVSPFRSSKLAAARARGRCGALEQRSGRGDENPPITLTYSLESLDSLSGDFGVGLSLAEALARRIKRNSLRLDQGRQIRQPALGACNIVIYDDEESASSIPSKRGEYHCVAGSVQSTDTAPSSWRGHLIKKLAEL